MSTALQVFHQIFFRAIFYICVQCGRYMTQRVSFEHYDDDDWASENSRRKAFRMHIFALKSRI